jgi:DNA-binding transcriptional ArsR family regulator
MILSCLLRGERNVAEIGDATQIVQPALSQQLGELRRANLVQTRKEAKQVWYQLADEDVTTCVRTMEAIFGGSGKLEDVLVARAPESVNMLAAGIAGFAKVLNRTSR